MTRHHHLESRCRCCCFTLGTLVLSAGCYDSACGNLWTSKTRLSTKEKKRLPYTHTKSTKKHTLLLLESEELDCRLSTCATIKKSVTAQHRGSEPLMDAGGTLLAWYHSWTILTGCVISGSYLIHLIFKEPYVGLGALAGCQAWASEVGELSSEHWTIRDLLAPHNINWQEISQGSPYQG